MSRDRGNPRTQALSTAPYHHPIKSRESWITVKPKTKPKQEKRTTQLEEQPMSPIVFSRWRHVQFPEAIPLHLTTPSDPFSVIHKTDSWTLFIQPRLEPTKIYKLMSANSLFGMMCLEWYWPDLHEGTFFLMKDGVYPKWESFPDGGRYMFDLPACLDLQVPVNEFTRGLFGGYLWKDNVELIQGMEVQLYKKRFKFWVSSPLKKGKQPEFDENIPIDLPPCFFQANSSSK